MFFVGVSAPVTNRSNRQSLDYPQNINEKSPLDDVLKRNGDESDDSEGEYDDVIQPMRMKGMQRRNAMTGTLSMQIMLMKVFEDPIYERHRRSTNFSVVPVSDDDLDDTKENSVLYTVSNASTDIDFQSKPSGTFGYDDNGLMPMSLSPLENRAMTIFDSIENMLAHDEKASVAYKQKQKQNKTTEINNKDMWDNNLSGRCYPVLSTTLSSKSASNNSIKNENITSDDDHVLTDISHYDTRQDVSSYWSLLYKACKNILFSRQPIDHRYHSNHPKFRMNVKG